MCIASVSPAAESVLWNPTDRAYENALMRLKAEAPSESFVVKSDADGAQLFESSGKDRHHYLATQGLFQQAHQECFLQTWDDGIDVFAVPRQSWATADEVSFVDLRAPGGVFVSAACGRNRAHHSAL